MVNQEQSDIVKIDAVDDELKQYKRSLGYESIPRELLQDNDLSLEAIGLLCNIASYPDAWVLKKTQVLGRFKHNKKTAVRRMWDELCEKGYIIQFRKRVEKRYSFLYYFSTIKMDLNDIVKLMKDLVPKGYILYTSKLNKKEDITRKNIINELPLSDSDKNKLENMDIIFWESENQNPKKHDDTSFSSGSDFENPNMGVPESETIRFTNNKSTRDYEEEDNIITRDEKVDFDSEIKRINQINPSIKPISDYLLLSNVNKKDVFEIAKHMVLNTHLIRTDLVIAQLKQCEIKASIDGGLVNFSKYFINGMEMRHDGSQARSSSSGEANLRNETQDDLPEIPMVNWAKGGAE